MRASRLIGGLGFLLLASGCMHPVFKMQPLIVPQSKALAEGEVSEMQDARYFSNTELRRRFCFELSAGVDTQSCLDTVDEPPYEIGLALAGGGSKAASYATGVLAGLQQGGWLQSRIDIMSTVSGGGYAALWYYSRLTDLYLDAQRYTRTDQEPPSKDELELELDAGAAPNVPGSSELAHHPDPTDGLFKDCLPWRYAGLLGFDAARGADLDVCPAGDPRTVSPQGDAWRFQNHLRGYADVLSNDFGDRPEPQQLDVAKALGLTLVTMPGHLVAHFVFDWKVPISPSQSQYRLGIERTYALPPVDLSQGCGDDLYGSDDCSQVRPVPNRLVGRGFTFATLQRTRREREVRLKYERTRDVQLPRVPMLVVNTTAGVSKTPFDLFERGLPDFEDSVFEFTPAGFGSRLYGYWPGSHPDVDVVTSVTASAAFFDSQQRSYGGTWRFLAGAGLRLFQLDWGIDIPNPWQPDRVRGRHSFLPFPFYYLYRQTKNQHAPHIHLSDGGQSDNTGIFSLIRRGTREIIFADESQDREGRFADLCVLQRKLAPKGLYLFIPELARGGETFAKQCSKGGNARRAEAGGVSIWAMQSPILYGCITRNPEDSQCKDRETRGYRANLYILKPSLDLPRLADALAKCERPSKDQPDQRQAFDANLGTQGCAAGYQEARRLFPEFPAEVFGYLAIPKNFNDWAWQHKRKPPLFPQHVTWRITLDSSPWVVGAYRELGKWHAMQLVQELEKREDEARQSSSDAPAKPFHQ